MTNFEKLCELVRNLDSGFPQLHVRNGIATQQANNCIISVDYCTLRDRLDLIMWIVTVGKPREISRLVEFRGTDVETLAIKMMEFIQSKEFKTTVARKYKYYATKYKIQH